MNTPSLPGITHIIYDMDGLLLDTEILYTEITQHIVSQFGKTFDWSVKARMIGRPALDSARHLVNALALPITAEQYLQQREQLLQQRFPHCQAMPGAEALIRTMHSHNIPQALASSSNRELFQLKTTHHGDWFALLDQIVLGDDPAIKQGKPAPDIFLTAAQRLGADPGACLVFEDAPSGVTAALAAGMSVIAIPDANMDKTAYHNATQMLSSLADFKPAQWSLPG